jgi:drug/metabolite transporter (DMT)-like permease
VIRFALGGGVTIVTGVVSSRYGPAVGGLFLALPAIFCASATLIERHEIRRKREAGLTGRRRGKMAAASDAAGAALGAVGMLFFGAAFAFLAGYSVVAAFVGASLAWLVVAVGAWCIRRKLRLSRKRLPHLEALRIRTRD